MLSPALAGDNARSLIFLCKIREFVPLFILLGSNAKIFYEYLDEIALRTETKKITYLGIGILRESQKISSFLSLCFADIVAECDTCLRLKKS